MRLRVLPSILAATIFCVAATGCQAPQQSGVVSTVSVQPQPEPATTKAATSEPTVASTSTTASTIEEGSYIGLGFAVKAPDQWTTIDSARVEGGFIGELLPDVENPDTVVAQIATVFETGILLAFYDFRDVHTTRYLTNVTVSSKPNDQPVDLEQQAKQTVKALQEDGYSNVTHSIEDVRAGKTVRVQYVLPQAQANTQSDLYISTAVVFANSRVWTITGITDKGSQAIADAVLQTAGSLQEI